MIVTRAMPGKRYRSLEGLSKRKYPSSFSPCVGCVVLCGVQHARDEPETLLSRVESSRVQPHARHVIVSPRCAPRLSQYSKFSHGPRDHVRVRWTLDLGVTGIYDDCIIDVTFLSAIWSFLDHIQSIHLAIIIATHFCPDLVSLCDCPTEVLLPVPLFVGSTFINSLIRDGSPKERCYRTAHAIRQVAIGAP